MSVHTVSALTASDNALNAQGVAEAINQFLYELYAWQVVYAPVGMTSYIDLHNAGAGTNDTPRGSFLATLSTPLVDNSNVPADGSTAAAQIRDILTNANFPGSTVAVNQGPALATGQNYAPGQFFNYQSMVSGLYAVWQNQGTTTLHIAASGGDTTVGAFEVLLNVPHSGTPHYGDTITDVLGNTWTCIFGS